MKKCSRVKNPCKICLKTVNNKTGVQCRGACKKWAHYTCLNYTPGKIQDIKNGIITITCPCPNCNTDEPKEYLTNPPFTCNSRECPANQFAKCVNVGCPSNKPSFNSPLPCGSPVRSGSPNSQPCKILPCKSPKLCKTPPSCGSPKPCKSPHPCGSTQTCKISSSKSPLPRKKSPCQNPMPCTTPPQCISPLPCDIPKTCNIPPCKISLPRKILPCESPNSYTSPPQFQSPLPCDIPKTCNMPPCKRAKSPCASPPCEIPMPCTTSPQCQSPIPCDIPKTCNMPPCKRAKSPCASPPCEIPMPCTTSPQCQSPIPCDIPKTCNMPPCKRPKSPRTPPLCESPLPCESPPPYQSQKQCFNPPPCQLPPPRLSPPILPRTDLTPPCGNPPPCGFPTPCVNSQSCSDKPSLRFALPESLKKEMSDPIPLPDCPQPPPSPHNKLKLVDPCSPRNDSPKSTSSETNLTGQTPPDGNSPVCQLPHPPLRPNQQPKRQVGRPCPIFEPSPSDPKLNHITPNPTGTTNKSRSCFCISKGSLKAIQSGCAPEGMNPKDVKTSCSDSFISCKENQKVLLSSIQQLCSTVGELSYQIKELMGKLFGEVTRQPRCM